MDTLEIVQGLRALREDLTVQGISQDEHDALDAAIARLSATCANARDTPENSEWVFVHVTGEWRCHCGYMSTSWDRFIAHFLAPPIAAIPHTPREPGQGGE